MNDKPINLNIERAKRGGDSRKMTVRDALEEALADVDEMGWSKCLLVLHRNVGDERFMVDLRIAGCTTLEARGLMLSWIKEEVTENDE